METNQGLKLWVKDFIRMYLFGLTSHRHNSLTLSLLLLLLLLLLEKTLQTAKNNNDIGCFLNHIRIYANPGPVEKLISIGYI